MTASAIQARFRHRFAATDSDPFELDVDLALPARGVTAIYGASGSGKTTLLRCIAGLQRADEGALSVQGSAWQDRDRFLPTHRRPLGYVFQEASLFPHLTAGGNLHYARRRAPNGTTHAELKPVAALLGITPLLERYPHQLSGGERQRVAIARALLIHPRLLLMDEPLAALDTERKQEILPYLERLFETLEMPVLYVSHAADELARLADHLVVLERGRVVADGPLGEVLARLDDPLKLGDDVGVVLDARITDRDGHWHLMKAESDGGALWLRDTGTALGQPVRVRILARDVSLSLSPTPDSSIVNTLAGTVVDIRPSDEATTLISVAVGASVLLARLTRRSVHELGLSADQPVWAHIKATALLR